MYDPGGGSGEISTQIDNPQNGLFQSATKRKAEDVPRDAKKPCEQQHINPATQHKTAHRTKYPTENRYLPTDPGPEYLVLVSTTDSTQHLGKYHASAICRILQADKISYDQVITVGKNTIKILFSTPTLANNFLESQYAAKKRWTAYIPNSRITREGVVKGLDMSTTKQEILEYTTGDNITIIDAHQLSRREENRWVPSSCWRLTFQGQELPKKVSFMGLLRNVAPYTRSVIKCLNYQVPSIRPHS